MPAEEEKKEEEENTIAEIKDENATPAADNKAAENETKADDSKPFIEYNREPAALKKNKKLERTNSSLGNNLPKKAKVTNPTFYSLIDNLQSGKYETILQSISTNVGSLRAKITKEARKKAEEEARREYGVDEAMRKINGGDNASADDMKKAANLLTLELERKISRATDPTTIMPLFEENKIALTNSRKHRIEFMEGGKVPRAIMIPALLKKSVSIIGNSSGRYSRNDISNANVIDFSSEVAKASEEGQALYKVDTKDGKEEKQAEKKKKHPKWESAFGNVKKAEKATEPILRSEIPAPPIPVSSKISKSELRERRTLAEAGESLHEIEKLKRTVGSGVPFNEGLIQRERELKKVIGDITGVVIPEAVNVIPNKNTDFQNDLERLLGVKAEPTREEHDKNQRKYESYFNDPDFVKQIERQKLEGVLYDMNTPSFAASIDKAERIDNERRAALSRQVNMEILDDNFDDVKVSAVETNKEAFTEAATEVVTEAPKTVPSEAQIVVTEVKTEPETEARVVTEVKTEPVTEPKKAKKKKPNFETDFKKFGLLSTKKIKRMKLTNVLPLEAKLFARQLHEENVRNEIIESAKVEAERLNTLNKLIEGAKEQANMLYESGKKAETDMIKAGAKDEARRLFELNKLIDGAQDQARILYESSKQADANNEIKMAATVEAARLYNINKILEAAKIQARMIYDADMHQMIVTSAEEEAKKLNDLNKILAGAYEQAQMLFNNNKAISESQAQAVEAARIKEMEEKKAAIERPVYEITDARSRYLQIIDFSKPIKLLNERYGFFRKNSAAKYTPSYRETLVSLRDELNDFEDSAGENVLQLKKVA